MHGPHGCSGGVNSHGGCDASAARGNVRGVSLGVGSGGCNEGDGEEGGRRRIRLVDRSWNL